MAQAAQDAEKAENQGDRWTFVAVLPETSFIHTTHSSDRTLAQAQVFVSEIRSKSDGQAPLFHSDSWFYEQALKDNYCTYQAVPYAGRGRPAQPKQVIDPDLSYVQVHKKRDSKGKIEKISTRIVLGEETKILNIFYDACRCKTVNTDYVASRNGNFVKMMPDLSEKHFVILKKPVFTMPLFDF